jgi:hypothetical protein
MNGILVSAVREWPNPSNRRKEVNTMDEVIGLETEVGSSEPDTGPDVQQEGDFQGEY